MSLPTAAEITRLYLYGQTTFSTPNLISDERIRPIANPANVVMAPAVDVNDYIRTEKKSVDQEQDGPFVIDNRHQLA